MTFLSYLDIYLLWAYPEFPIWTVRAFLVFL